jgi:hypothetical protein
MRLGRPSEATSEAADVFIMFLLEETPFGRPPANEKVVPPDGSLIPQGDLIGEWIVPYWEGRGPVAGPPEGLANDFREERVGA